MVITKLEEYNKNKLKVYIDEEFAFPIFSSDAKEACLEEGMEISEDIYSKLLIDIVFPRAKQKALNLLKFMDRTKNELKDRLAFELYPEDIIGKAVAFTEEYGFVNDTRYAENYIHMRKENKSKLVIRNELLNKGINKEILDNILLSEYKTEDEDPEIIAIRKIIDKKNMNISTMSWEDKQKLIAFLYRRGFNIDKIKASNSCLF